MKGKRAPVVSFVDDEDIKLNRMISIDITNEVTNYTCDTLGNLLLETVKDNCVDYIIGKMIEFDAPFLFCRFSREAYTIDLSKRNKLKNDLKAWICNEGNDIKSDIKYDNTDDMIVTVQLSQEQFTEGAKFLFEYFSELLVVVPQKSIGWRTFLDIFWHGHPANQIKKVRMMSHEVILISTDEGVIQINI